MANARENASAAASSPMTASPAASDTAAHTARHSEAYHCAKSRLTPGVLSSPTAVKRTGCAEVFSRFQPPPQTLAAAPPLRTPKRPPRQDRTVRVTIRASCNAGSPAHWADLRGAVERHL